MMAAAPPPRIAPSMQQASKPRMGNTHLSSKHWAPACFLVNGQACGAQPLSMVPPHRYASAPYFSSFIFKALPLLSSALSSLLSWMWALVTDQPPLQTGFPQGGMLFCLALLCLSALLLPHTLSRAVTH